MIVELHLKQFRVHTTCRQLFAERVGVYKTSESAVRSPSKQTKNSFHMRCVCWAQMSCFIPYDVSFVSTFVFWFSFSILCVCYCDVISSFHRLMHCDVNQTCKVRYVILVSLFHSLNEHVLLLHISSFFYVKKKTEFCLFNFRTFFSQCKQFVLCDLEFGF